ncbi:hypothetical protein PLICRDRAFT_47472 [Plicaturopsis crispa FD-325 SS-3]|uniref:Uncharacterized protein n=1 Tax=Plicaturopsis crispa FD-325 SS-3 TaxID=944288 RepID=A0A0C9SPP9_PLICR|nr:hypothetical protein PLICRDRAFT_47474 [Plicaturopsis crispa FD-325 SS-3]KII82862.1 hypothetical protein PLICRDRAFT_47472 [Plicaturopsis crispa FD-325 SS-3]
MTRSKKCQPRICKEAYWTVAPLEGTDRLRGRRTLLAGSSKHVQPPLTFYSIFITGDQPAFNSPGSVSQKVESIQL